MPVVLAAAAPFLPVDQEYLFEARQMQALSFAVHIPLVCFGIAFPAFVLALEGLWLRTGDPVYRTIAQRWSKVMLALFAVGVVTGTILSFELGLLWPAFMAEVWRWRESCGGLRALPSSSPPPRAGWRRSRPEPRTRRACDARRGPLVVMLVGLTAYAVLGGADFGAAFWQLAARSEAAREHAYRAMGPVWEARYLCGCDGSRSAVRDLTPAALCHPIGRLIECQSLRHAVGHSWDQTPRFIRRVGGTGALITTPNTVQSSVDLRLCCVALPARGPRLEDGDAVRAVARRDGGHRPQRGRVDDRQRARPLVDDVEGVAGGPYRERVRAV